MYFRHRPTPVTLLSDPDCLTHRACGVPQAEFLPEGSSETPSWPYKTTLDQFMAARINPTGEMPEAVQPMEANTVLNAKDGFVPEIGEINLEGSGAKPAISVGDLRKGRLPLTLTTPAGMGEGEIELDVALTWLRKNGGLGRMTWPITVKVVSKVEPKPPSPPKGGQAPTKDGGDVAFIWVSGHDQGWEDKVVGELHDIEGDVLASEREVYADLKGVKDKIPTIVLNKDFADWSAYRRTIAKGASDATLETRNERYGLAVGIIVANMTLEERKLLKKHEAWEAKENGTEEPPRAMSSEQMQRALAEAARGVVALMPDFDALTADLEPNG